MRLSVVIPAFEAQATLEPLLDSIQRELEAQVVVVDDGSTDGTAALARARSDVDLVELRSNRGPGHARNQGVQRATGDTLLFLDSDVVLCPGFDKVLRQEWARQQGGEALVGLLSLRPAADHRFARYKAAHMWAYTQDFLERTQGVGANFTTQVGVVSRELFLDVGGFSEDPRITWIEDDELGYRLAERVPVRMVPGLEVAHHFDRFGPATRKIRRQSALWTQHFLGERRRFDAIGKTRAEAINKLAAGSLVLAPNPLSLTAFLYTSAPLLRVCQQEYGSAFTAAALGMHAATGAAASLGALRGLVPGGRP